MNTREPYSPPAESETKLTPHKPQDDLRTIAFAQRRVNYAAMLHLFVSAPISTVGLDILKEMRISEGASWSNSTIWTAIVLGLVLLCVGCFSASSLYKLARIRSGNTVAILQSIGAILPLLGLVLLVQNSVKAAKILQENGIKVGAMGADLNSF